MTNANSVAQTPDKGESDSPTPTVTRRSMLDSLPERLAADSYVRYLAEQCDEARADRDENRTKVYELLDRGIKLEAERNELRAKLRGVQMWTPRDVAATCLVVAGALYFVLAVVIDLVNAIVTKGA